MFASVLLFPFECGQMVRTRTKSPYSLCSLLRVETPLRVFSQRSSLAVCEKRTSPAPPSALLPHFRSCETLPSSSTSCPRRKQVLSSSRSMVLFCLLHRQLVLSTRLPWCPSLIEGIKELRLWKADKPWHTWKDQTKVSVGGYHESFLWLRGWYKLPLPGNLNLLRSWTA